MKSAYQPSFKIAVWAGFFQLSLCKALFHKAVLGKHSNWSLRKDTTSFKKQKILCLKITENAFYRWAQTFKH
jgi:hypothetical protein